MINNQFSNNHLKFELWNSLKIAFGSEDFDGELSRTAQARRDN